MLEANGREYDVIVSIGERQSRVWARIVISRPHGLAVEPQEAALAVAESRKFKE